MSARIAVILLAAISVRAQDATGSITGIVQDPAGVPDAYLPLKLEVPGGSLLDGQTDNLGVFRFQNLPAGEYILRVQHLGFSSLDVKFDLSTSEQGSLPPLILELAHADCGLGRHPSYIRFLSTDSRSGSLTGTVKETSENASAAVAGAAVTLLCKVGESCGRTRTDSAGFFAFENLAPGSYGLNIDYVFDTTHWAIIGYGEAVNAGVETSYSFGLHLTSEEKARKPEVCE